MFELVIWASNKFDFQRAGNTLLEDPRTNLLHDFDVRIRDTSITEVEFLREFEWAVLEANCRPQCHMVILDSRELVSTQLEILKRVCACSMAFVTARPMKYLAFYDIQSQVTLEQTMQGSLLYQFLHEHASHLQLYVKVILHEGAPLANKYLGNGNMGMVGMKTLTRNIIIQTQMIFQND
jgi:hypothetical protein